MKLMTSIALAVGVLLAAVLSIAAPASAGGVVGVQVGVPGPGYGGVYRDYRAYCADPWYRQTYAYYCDRYYAVGYADEGYYDEGYYGGPSYGGYPYYGTLFSFGYANGYYNDYNHGYRGYWGGNRGYWGGNRGHWGGGRHGNWSGHNGNRHGGRGRGRR